MVSCVDVDTDQAEISQTALCVMGSSIWPIINRRDNCWRFNFIKRRWIFRAVDYFLKRDRAVVFASVWILLVRVPTVVLPSHKR